MIAPPPKAVLLIALSARPYVQALKQAGYYTVVIDGFLDQETRFFADKAYQIDFDGSGFGAEQLQGLVAQLAPMHTWLGCLYGAGVEAQPALLELVGDHMPILGNTTSACSTVKSPDVFFSACADLSINTPKWQLMPPKELQSRWLRKTVGAAGGGHIQFVKPSDQVGTQFYFQQAINGESVSVLFVALPEELGIEPRAVIIGVHSQWADASQEQPYRLGGLVALDEIAFEVELQLQQIVQKLTAGLALIGLNSLDVIVQGNKVSVLELNPRLSLSLDLYLQDYNDDAQVNLLALHLLTGLFAHRQDAALKKQIEHAIANVMAYHKRLRSSCLFKAIAIVYAPISFDLKEHVLWPEWVVDRPAKAGRIELNSPVCSVFASAKTTALAKEQVLKRVTAIKQNAELISSN